MESKFCVNPPPPQLLYSRFYGLVAAIAIAITRVVLAGDTGEYSVFLLLEDIAFHMYGERSKVASI